MQTSLGIWAFGPMVTRFVPGGYQPAHDYHAEPVADKVHRAVEGLGDLMDGYEFHYPNELSHENLHEVQAALGEHDMYASPLGFTWTHGSAAADSSTRSPGSRRGQTNHA